MAESRTQTILEKVQADIVSAIGTGTGATFEITTANIVDLKLPYKTDSGPDLPGVLITPVPEIERDGTNASDDVGFGVQVTIAQNSNRDLEGYADRLYWWRETIAGLFRNKRFPAVAGSYKCVIEPKPVIDPAAFGDLFDATAFVVRVWVRIQRPS